MSCRKLMIHIFLQGFIIFGDNIDAIRSLAIKGSPTVYPELLVKALEKSGNDLDSAIKSLNELCLGYVDGASGSPVQSNAVIDKGPATAENVSLENSPANDNIPKSGPEWVELFVTEMTTATSIDDARLEP